MIWCREGGLDGEYIGERNRDYDEMVGIMKEEEVIKFLRIGTLIVRGRGLEGNEDDLEGREERV